MRERPAPDSLNLTPGERGLCIVLAMLWGGIVLLTFPAVDGLFSWLADMFAWAREPARRLLEGRLPVSSLTELARLFITSFWVGGAILGPLYFAYLFRFGRWLRPATLWFWTMLHWALPVLFALAAFGDELVPVSPAGRARFNPSMWGLVAGLSITPLTLVFFSQRAWRRRKSAGAE